MSAIDGYENPDPTTPPPSFADLKVPVRPIPPLSQRIMANILALEARGDVARHHSYTVIPKAGIWRKMGNKTFYRLFGLHYYQHDSSKKENGIQKAIDNAHSKVFLKDAYYQITTGVTTLATGISLEGESMPKLLNVDPTAPEQITFSDIGATVPFVHGVILDNSTPQGNDCFTGNLLRTIEIRNMGLNNFANGFQIGAANKLGIANAAFERILYSNCTTPLNLMNFQMLRLNQHYAWCPSSTGNMILAQNNNSNWFGGNSYWCDIFGHGFKNVNGAFKFVAVAGVLNLIEAHRLQVNMQDAAFTNSTSGYGLYLQGQVTVTGQCNNNTFHALNIEGTPLKAVRLEDYSFYNYVHIALDNLSAGGFDFSLKKNLSAQAPLNNMLVYSNTQTVAVESDNLQNFLVSSGALTPVTGTFPAGINGVGLLTWAGGTFTTMYGGGSGQAFVGGTTKGTATAQTAPANLVSAATPATNQEYEVGAELIVTAFTSGTLQIQVTFTDQFNNARTVILPLNNNGTFQTGATATGYYNTQTNTISGVSAGTITVKVIGVFTATYTGSGFVRATG